MAIDISQQVDDTSADVEEDEVAAGLERFRDWAHSDLYPEFGKFSYIQGVLEAEMSPESLHEHNSVKTRVSAALCNLTDELQLGEVYSDGSMYVNEEVGLATEPDVLLCTWESLESGRAKLRPYKNSKKGLVELHGTPDLMVEIISPSSTKKDKVRLKKAYFECGIPEYWLIDARGKKLDFKLFVRGEQEYQAVSADVDGYLYSPLLKRAVFLGRTSHPIVGYRYQLLFRIKD